MGLKDGINFKMAKRPLDFVYLIDVSGSMANENKIETVNNAMNELKDDLLSQASMNTNADVNIRIIVFGNDEAKWYIRTRTSIESFFYRPITNVDGSTPVGKAFSLLNKECQNGIPAKSLRPVIVLLSDGMANDSWEGPLDEFLKTKYGHGAIKIAIAIGHKDIDYDMLTKFTGDPNNVLTATNASSLVNFIRWTSTLAKTAAKEEKVIKKPGTVKAKDDVEFL